MKLTWKLKKWMRGPFEVKKAVVCLYGGPGAGKSTTAAHL